MTCVFHMAMFIPDCGMTESREKRQKIEAFLHSVQREVSPSGTTFTAQAHNRLSNLPS